MMIQLALGLALLVQAQAPAPPLPFAPGEELNFLVRSSRFGKIGTSVMRVRSDTIRGRDVYLLSFDFRAKILLFSATDQTKSWFDPETRSSLRYWKKERSPVGKRDEAVEIFGTEGYWLTSKDRFACSSPDPLDELSFLYFLRVLPLEAGATYEIRRHFDETRNPVTVKVLRREALTDPDFQATYQTVVVEMRVRDSRQDKGYSVLRLHITDDEFRVPVRIESSMPVGGTMTMTLQSRLVR